MEEKIFQNYIKFVRKNKIQVDKTWKRLANGVYELPDKRILKFSKNTQEINAASKIKRTRKKLKYLNQIYDITFFNNPCLYGYMETSGPSEIILMPKYKSLSAKEKNELYSLFCYHQFSKT